MFTSLLLALALALDSKAPTVPPTVTADEQIKLLQIQLKEVVAENASLKAKIERIDVVNSLMDGWNKRGCIIESDDKGLLHCKVTPEKIPEKKEQAK